MVNVPTVLIANMSVGKRAGSYFEITKARSSVKYLKLMFKT